jgi:hypothetical protein
MVDQSLVWIAITAAAWVYHARAVGAGRYRREFSLWNGGRTC